MAAGDCERAKVLERGEVLRVVFRVEMPVAWASVVPIWQEVMGRGR